MYYYVRGFEEELEKRLRRFGLVCVLGLPGVGKSSTAKYLCCKHNHVIFVPRRYFRFPEDLKASDGISGFINYEVLEFNLWERADIKEVAYIILKVFKAKKKVRRKWREVVGKIRNDLAEKFGEDGKKLVKLLKEGTIESVKGSFDRIAEKFESRGVAGRIKMFLRELHPIDIIARHIREIIHEIDEHLDISKGNVHAFEIATCLMMKNLQFEAVYPWAMMVLLFSGCLHLKESLKKIFEGDVLKALKKEVEKEEILIVFDDLNDFSRAEKLAIGDLIEKFKVEEFVNLGFKVLINYRLTDNEFLEFTTMNERDVVSKLRDELNLSDDILNNVDQVFFYPQPNFEEFKEILKANGFDVDESYYYDSFGIPWVAILMKSVGVKPKVEEVKDTVWYPREKVEDTRKAREELGANLRKVYDTLRRVYEKLKDENFCYVALLVNDLAKDELEEFCKRVKDKLESRGYKCFYEFEDRFKDVGGIDLSRFLIKDKEKWLDGERTVFELKQDFVKLRSVLDGLNVDEDLKLIREVLLEIFDEELEKSGRSTYRMLWFGLENVRWLFKRGILKPKSAFIWGSIALIYLPRFGAYFSLNVVLKIWSEKREEIVKDRETLLYALKFARDLAGLRSFSGKGYYEIAKKVEDILNMEGDDVVSCWKSSAYSSLAYGLLENGFEDYSYKVFGKAKEFIEKSGRLRILAVIEYLISKAQIESIIANPRKAIETLNYCLILLNNLKFEDSMKEFFKPLGGKAVEKFEVLVKEWKKIVNYELGCAYLFVDLDEAKKYFLESLKFATRFADILVCLGKIGSINVLRDFKFEFDVGGENYDFKKLWEMCKDRIYKVGNEAVAGTCANYLVSSILFNKSVEEKLLDYLEFNITAKTLFYGLSWILGFRIIEFKDLIRVLRDFDLMCFPSVDNAVEQDQIDEAKIETEWMYDSYLNNDVRKFEIYKKLVWNKAYRSPQALARIMFFYIIGDLKTAKDLAKLTGAKSKSKGDKVPSKLYKELAEAIDGEINTRSDDEKKEAKEKVKKAFVKLFYWHV